MYSLCNTSTIFRIQLVKTLCCSTSPTMWRTLPMRIHSYTYVRSILAPAFRYNILSYSMFSFNIKVKHLDYLTLRLLTKCWSLANTPLEKTEGERVYSLYYHCAIFTVFILLFCKKLFIYLFNSFNSRDSQTIGLICVNLDLLIDGLDASCKRTEYDVPKTSIACSCHNIYFIIYCLWCSSYVSNF